MMKRKIPDQEVIPAKYRLGRKLIYRDFISALRDVKKDQCQICFEEYKIGGLSPFPNPCEYCTPRYRVKRSNFYLTKNELPYFPTIGEQHMFWGDKDKNQVQKYGTYKKARDLGAFSWDLNEYQSACYHCFQQSLVNSKIEVTRDGIFIMCPLCLAIGEREDLNWEDLLPVLDQKTVSQISEEINQEVIAKMPDFRKCPAPNCQFGALYTRPSNSQRKCKNYSCPEHGAFCFDCNEPKHQGLSCEDVRLEKRILDKNEDLFYQWTKKINDRDRMSGYHNGIKECPNCHAVIQKLDGCSDMACKQCGKHFNWSKDSEQLSRKYNEEITPQKRNAIIKRINQRKRRRGEEELEYAPEPDQDPDQKPEKKKFKPTSSIFSSSYWNPFS